MSYLVLARKWRPKTFSDLVGQEHVVQTLRNAILQDRVAQAFLFTGARGVGKTTIARIMAKALNCLGAPAATPEPCLACSACTEIADGRDPDVLEIDGASNNGVDDVRRLMESLPYRPVRDRYKVVILDECHMVTKEGWNALLKTLEEPHPHVKFVFATTEAHKLLPTILSRVQRYDFRLIPTQGIRDRLAHVLRAEGMGFDDAAVSLVAREAAGSVRDALSLLDQVIAGVDREITGAAAARLLGVADRKVLYDLGRAMLSGDGAASLRCVDAIAREGYDLPNVAKGLLGVLRDLVVARVVQDSSDLLDLADDERAEVLELAGLYDAVDLERLFAAWARVTEEVARAREPRWALEMAVVRLSHRPSLVPVEDLLSRLHELERRISSGGGGGPRPSGGAPSPGAAPPAAPASAPRAAPAAATAPAPRPASSNIPAGSSVTSALPASQRFSVPSGSTGGGGAPMASAAQGAALRAPAPQTDPGIQSAVAQPVVAPSAVTAPATMSWLDKARAAKPERRAEPAAPTPTPTAAPESARAVAIDTSAAEGLLPVWRQLVDATQGNLGAVLKSAVPLEVGPARVCFAVDAGSSFIRRKLETAEATKVVQDAAERIFQTRPAVELVTGTLGEDALSILRADERIRDIARRARETAARTHPLVLMVCAELGAEVAKVKLDGEGP